MKKKIFTKDNLIFFLILNLGLIFTAVGISIFKTPNHFAFGGTSGLSIILSTLFPKWNVGAFMWIVNAALVVLGFFFLGIRSMGWTIYSSFALSFYVSACEVIYPLSFPLTHDVFLELCFAVILPAVGASNLQTGIFMQDHGYNIGTTSGSALLVSDLGIVLIAAYLYGAQTGLYCILGMILKCTVVDSAIESLNLRKVCTIISKYPDQVEDFIINDLHRSATEQNAFGVYTKQEQKVLMTVLTRSETNRLRIHLRQIDPHAFITIVNSSEIIGKGFRSI